MEIQNNIPLRKYTTFRIGGPADYFLIAENKKEIIEALNFAKEKNLKVFILGGGSNILFSDKGWNGVVIKIHNLELEVEEENILAGAGLKLGALVKRSFKEGLSGLEWAAGIPGTLGGAIFGNAGAFDGEMADVVERVEVYDIKNKKIIELTKEECCFGYRTSIFKNNYNFVILSACLRLEQGIDENISEKINSYLDYRHKKHPKDPSAGSCFKNISVENLSKDFFEKFPETKEVVKDGILPIAFLIHSCGLKGERIGDIEVSTLHPNFIINTKDGSSEDVLKLICLIKKKIKEKYGLEIEEEIKILDKTS